jgi:hypothetical protein
MVHVCLQEAPTAEDVYYNDTTLLKIVRPHAEFLTSLAKPVENCTSSSMPQPLLLPKDVWTAYPDELPVECNAQYGMIQVWQTHFTLAWALNG